MPPWPPGPDSPPLQNERTLSPEEINLLVDWAEAGALVGDPDNQPLDSYAEAIAQDLQPDLVLTVDPPYQPDQSRQDDYRCFLLNPDLERDAFVSSYRVRPEQATMVHHALLYVIGPRAVARAEAVDGGEAGPGWACFGGPGVGSDISTLDILGFWVPGGGGTAFPEGTGKLLKAGSRLIMQLHYNLAAREGVGLDSSSVDLFLASPTDELKPIHELALAAPVEVRCPGPYPADPADLCNRDYALERSELKYLANGIHIACGTRPEEYLSHDVGDGSGQEMSCDRGVQTDAIVLGVTGHMHLRGSWIKIELNPDTPQARTLLHIPDWDFDWQGQYWFKERMPLAPEDTVRITCTYDNSASIAGPDGSPLPPRYMTWGEGTTDEMCLGALSFVRP